MSLDKGVEHGKEKRRKFKGAKAWDCSCRNHGDCSWCEGTRTHNTKRRMKQSEYECDLCFDTGCSCGGIGLTCDGCCRCIRDINEAGRIP